MKKERRNKGESLSGNGYYVTYQDGVQQYTHIMVAEAALGRKLPRGAQVHHLDLSAANNNPTNLVICPDQSYHFLLHRRTNALLACGNADYRRCGYCGEYDSKENLTKSVRRFFHNTCRSAHRRNLREQGKNA